MNQSLIAFVILAAMLAASDLLAVKSKAILDSMLTFSVILCVAFWLGMPYSVIEASNFLPFAYVALALMLTNMGSNISLNQFYREWKTVCIGFVQVVVICVVVYWGGSLFVGKTVACASAPIIAGGFVAYLVIVEPLIKAGMQEALSFCLLLMIAQSLIGIPIASALAKREAKRMLFSGEIEMYRNMDLMEEGVPSAKLKKFLLVPEKYNKPSLMLTKLGIVAVVGVTVSNLTGVNFLICCLIMGVLAGQLGFLEKNSLNKAGAEGLVMLIVTVYTFESVVGITPELFVSLLQPFVIIMAIGVIAILVGGFLCSRIFKVSFLMASSIGITALFGFPATYYVAMEVAETCGKNEAEKEALENYLVTKLMVAGFATVSVGSIVAASVMVPVLASLIT